MSKTLTRSRSRLRRTLAGAMTTALAASTLALLPTTAQADPAPAAAPALTWKISQQFVDHLSTRTLAGGATFSADSGFTFVNGTGYFDAGNGAASMAYQGSVRGAFAMAGTEYYSVTVANPVVAVDSQGDGTISAVVSSTAVAQGTTPASSTPPTRVVVTTFDANSSDWTSTGGMSTLAATPNWAGVLPADSTESTALGIKAGQPVDDKAFASSFLGAIAPGVRAHFYASGATSDAKKNPASFTASVGAPATKVTVTSTTPSEGVALAIAGSGFSKSTNPGDAGIYAGIAPSGGLPDVSTQNAMASFAAAVPVWSAAIGTDGSFTATLRVAPEKLDPSKSYSVYTWRAHTHSTTSQDTETPVAIDFSALAKATSAPAISAPRLTHGKVGTVTVTVPQRGATAPTGNVALSGAVNQTAALSNGTATFALPKTLTAGSRALTASYSGDANYAASSASTTLTIAKAGVKATAKVTKRPTSKKKGKATITVKSATSGKPTGKVVVTFKKGKTTKKVTKWLSNGKAKITVPKLSKGSWKMSVKYNGSTNFAKTATKKVATVKVKK
ncbi:Ig-like domain repeat protein [Aeromicrobium wangtongii]|uniref:Ig-like domain repeat protein n=1 Tax=Aeromicrobium wangtongii TaxID=2969247 RepID=UPI002016CC17|nr:Ig-like domain repeat protein [Aeromicrobium wangtongii]MCL3819872.1 Ig-like domain repeat protein [Aeromicrobium wangtongii]